MSDPAPRLASAGKVAIPALRPRAEPVEAPAAIAKGKRTAKACVECKSKKIKCSGTRPTCDYCEQSQVPCVFADGRRERSRKANARGHRLLHLLREASSQATLPRHILDELKSLEAELVDDAEYFGSENTPGSKKRDRSPAMQPDGKRARIESDEHANPGEVDAAADVGSEESVDLAAEDFNRSEAKKTGFIGRHSEIAWAQRLAHVQAEGTGEHSKDTTSHGEAGTGEGAGPGRVAAIKSRHAPGNAWNDSISDFAYHLDNDRSLKLDQVDPDELPPPEQVNTLVECYLENVHNFYPVLIRPDFTEQFQSFLRTGGRGTAPATWRAMLNMVLAIGAKFSHLTSAPWHGDDRDHLIYHTRALQLCPINESTMVQPDIQRIQVVALVSFYYLTIGHVSRSWVMLGVACRQAIALGLHLRQLAPSMSFASREKRARIWWSLYYLEYLLCQITGRPTMINHQFCSVPVLAPVDESALASDAGNKQLEDWNNSQGDAPSDENRAMLDLEAAANATNHFRARVQLAIITQKIFTNLYSATTVSKTWQRVQEEITALGQEVDQWYRSLPREYQFTLSLDDDDDDDTTNENLTRERVILAFGYYSAQMILSRPCLCRIDQRLANQSLPSKRLDTKQARECIMAARSIAALLPSTSVVPDAVWLYTHGPWWCIVHHLMQAITILMLELAFEESHMLDSSSAPTHDEPDIEPDHRADLDRIARKLVRWLSLMAAAGNPAAAAACTQARAQFEGFRAFDFDASGLVRDVQRYNGAEHVAGGGGHQQQRPPGYFSPGARLDGPAPAPALMADALGLEKQQQQWATSMPFFAETWDGVVADDGVDWNASFLNTPYDLFNPLASATGDLDLGTQFWIGQGDGGGGEEGGGAADDGMGAGSEFG